MPSYLYLRKDGDFSISKLICSEIESQQGDRHLWNKFIRYTPAYWVREEPFAILSQNCYPILGKQICPSLCFSGVFDGRGVRVMEFRYSRRRMDILKDKKRRVVEQMRHE